MKKHFDEREHPRGAKGTPLGGKFVKKDGSLIAFRMVGFDDWADALTKEGFIERVNNVKKNGLQPGQPWEGSDHHRNRNRNTTDCRAKCEYPLRKYYWVYID